MQNPIVVSCLSYQHSSISGKPIMLLHKILYQLSHIVFPFSCPVDVDDTVHFLPTDDSRTKRYEIEAFSFVGDHQFVYMHCKVRICNASDPHSRCAKGCIPPRERRSLNAVSQSKDEEAYLAEGPFMRGDGDEDETKDIETEKDIKVEETSGELVSQCTVMLSADTCKDGNRRRSN